MTDSGDNVMVSHGIVTFFFCLSIKKLFLMMNEVHFLRCSIVPLSLGYSKEKQRTRSPRIIVALARRTVCSPWGVRVQQ